MSDNPYMINQECVTTREKSWKWATVAASTVAVLELMAILASAAGMAELASQPKTVPMIVEVDKVGQVIAVEKVTRPSPVDAKIIHATLADWITNARLVTPDVSLQRAAVFKVYSHLSSEDPSFVKMNDWLNGSADSSPFKRAEEETVSTEVLSCIQQTNDTWQIDWMEKVYERKGSLLHQDRMRALVTVAVTGLPSSTTEEDIRRNPLGIFIRDFNWARQAS